MQTVDDYMRLAAARYPDVRTVIYHPNGRWAYDGRASAYIPDAAWWAQCAIEDARICNGTLIINIRSDGMQLSLW